ncbi:hypothetical protein A0H81_10570 [Grifola frondosa]|uniref:Vesicular-fusion protein SEC18 n=1 Tax=Grifola frondosa TaxID=5627 RepID=A0A1C7LZ87_GRIFR|nr:hypothetical protein A0H81_10570 [Grifola frondosa]
MGLCVRTGQRATPHELRITIYGARYVAREQSYSHLPGASITLMPYEKQRKPVPSHTVPYVPYRILRVSDTLCQCTPQTPHKDSVLSLNKPTRSHLGYHDTTGKLRPGSIGRDGTRRRPARAELTKNFSGAEINSLVKSTTSFAFSRHVKVGTFAGISDDIENLRVNRTDFLIALNEVQPTFGASKEEMEQLFENGIIHYGSIVDDLLCSGELFVDQVCVDMHTTRQHPLAWRHAQPAPDPVRLNHSHNSPGNEWVINGTEM